MATTTEWEALKSGKRGTVWERRVPGHGYARIYNSERGWLVFVRGGAFATALTLLIAMSIANDVLAECSMHRCAGR